MCQGDAGALNTRVPASVVKGLNGIRNMTGYPKQSFKEL